MGVTDRVEGHEHATLQVSDASEDPRLPLGKKKIQNENSEKRHGKKVFLLKFYWDLFRVFLPVSKPIYFRTFL